MLETLTRGFRSARDKLQGKAQLTEENIGAALRDVRVSLLEADVELGVTREFLARVRERAVGEVVKLRAPKKALGNLPPGTKVTPADHFIKICHDELVGLMGEATTGLNVEGRPATIMMVGLQGSGKTTTAGKLARKLQKEGKKPLLVAADIYRPAAVDQLVQLGQKLGVPVFSIKGMDPVELSRLALQQARNVGRDVVIIDTAGRLAIDDALMGELERIASVAKPSDILFVCDAMIGQDAVRTAAEFDRRLSFTGFVLTKLDGDARGGAALSIKEVTGKPVQFVGMGEGLDKLEDFRPEGLADRILGFGDVVGLMKDFEQVVDKDEAEADARKMLQGQFTFGDFLKQINMLKRMGSLRSVFERLPGVGELLEQLPPEALDDRELGKVVAMIHSMTPQERNHPDIANPSRMARIARGSGRALDEVQALYERFEQMRGMMGSLGQSAMFDGVPGLGGGRAARRSRRGGAPAGFPGMGALPGAESPSEATPGDRKAAVARAKGASGEAQAAPEEPKEAIARHAASLGARSRPPR